MAHKPPSSEPLSQPAATGSQNNHDFMSGGGEMGEAMRRYNWSDSPLGDPESWPQSLRTTVSIILNSAFPMRVWWNKDHMVNIYNDAYKQILGDKHKNALGKKASEIWSEIWDEISDFVDEVFATGKPLYVKNLKLLINRHGFEEETYFTFSYSPIHDESGDVAGLFCAVTETTEEVIEKRKREENQAKLEGVLQSVADGIGVFDMNGDLVILNESLATINGYSSTDAMKQNLKAFHENYQFVLPDSNTVLPLDEWPVARAMRGESFTDMELRGKQLDTGREWYFSFSGSPIRDSEGKQTLAVTVTRDITQRKKAEEELRESELRFKKLADSAPMYIAMADASGNAVYFNKPWLEFTGKTHEQMIGMGWLSALHPEDAPKFERDFKRAFEARETINKQYRFKRADGEYRWMLAVGAPRFTEEDRFIGYYGTYTDFHDLKIAQMKVQESEERFRTVANNISQLVWTTDNAGKVSWYNQRWYDYTGTTFEETRAYGWKKVLHPQHRKRVIEGFQASLESGGTWEDTFPLKGHDGKYRWFLSRAIPIRDASNTIVRWFGTNTDIDDLRRATRRKSELENITAALREQRIQLLSLNQAKDEFISLASHQLRTPATGVKQYIGMLLEGYVGDISASQRKFLETAYDSNERQLQIVNDLLKVARVDSGKLQLQREKIDLVPMLQAVIDEQAAEFKNVQQNIRLVHEQPKAIAYVDQALIRMAVENLVDNAHKYTPAGKNVEVRIASNKTGVHVTVKDEGIGIDAADQNKLFKKFSRIDNPLSSAAGGTGLGLYWVKRVIDLHEGTIEVRSRTGEGTEFTLTLPIAAD